MLYHNWNKWSSSHDFLFLLTFWIYCATTSSHQLFSDFEHFCQYIFSFNISANNILGTSWGHLSFISFLSFFSFLSFLSFLSLSLFISFLAFFIFFSLSLSLLLSWQILWSFHQTQAVSLHFQWLFEFSWAVC